MSDNELKFKASKHAQFDFANNNIEPLRMMFICQLNAIFETWFENIDSYKRVNNLMKLGVINLGNETEGEFITRIWINSIKLLNQIYGLN